MLPRRILIPFVLAIGLALPAAAARADQAADARALVQHIADRAVAILKTSDKAARERGFLDLFRNSFNSAAIARFVLGPYRGSVGPAAFARYKRVFDKLVAKTTTARLAGYAGERLRVLTARADGRHWIVRSEVGQPGKTPVHLDWVIGRSKSGLKVLDIRVENLSLAITERDEFDSVLQANGGNMDKLVAFMEEKIRKLNSGAEAAMVERH